MNGAVGGVVELVRFGLVVIAMFAVSGGVWFLVIRQRLRRDRAWDEHLREPCSWDEVLSADLGGIPITAPYYVWKPGGRRSGNPFVLMEEVIVAADSHGMVFIAKTTNRRWSIFQSRSDYHDLVLRPGRLGGQVLEDRRHRVSIFGADTVAIAAALRSLGWTVGEE